MTSHRVDIGGKVYIVNPPRAYVVGGAVVVAYHYWSTRNGEAFGPIRIAANDSTGKVGRALVAAARELFNADHDAMIAAVHQARANGARNPSVSLIVSDAR